MNNKLSEAIKQYSKDSELIIGVPDDDNQDENFTPSGCDIVDTLACDTQTVDCLLIKRNIAGRIIESYKFQADVCHMVLDAYHNGTEYFLNERGDWVPEWEMPRTKRA